MATWRITSPVVGYPRIADTSTTQDLPLGTIVQAKDASYGVGEFIYLKGVASTAVGSWVTYNMDDGTTTLLAAGAKGPVAVAMSANVANQYGWYQIQGKADAKVVTASGAITDDDDLYIGTTAGEANDTTVAGDRIWGVKTASINTTLGMIEAEIHRPFVNAGSNAST